MPGAQAHLPERLNGSMRKVHTKRALQKNPNNLNKPTRRQ